MEKHKTMSGPGVEEEAVDIVSGSAELAFSAPLILRAAVFFLAVGFLSRDPYLVRWPPWEHRHPSVPLSVSR